MASLEAILRRRMNRASAHQTERAKANGRAAAEGLGPATATGAAPGGRFSADAIDELIHQLNMAPEQITWLHRDYRYWQAAACGWNPSSPLITRISADVFCDAGESAFWHWWTSLHPKRRDVLARLSSLCAESEHDPIGLSHKQDPFESHYQAIAAG
jgi:hypothetical protein